MKVIKQLKKLQTFLDSSKRDRHKKRKKLKKLLGKMNSKEKHLVNKTDSAKTKKDKARLEQEVALLHAQRKKGLKALKKLRGSDA